MHACVCGEGLGRMFVRSTLSENLSKVVALSLQVQSEQCAVSSADWRCRANRLLKKGASNLHAGLASWKLLLAHKNTNEEFVTAAYARVPTH